MKESNKEQTQLFPFVVCIDPVYTRNLELLNTADMPDERLEYWDDDMFCDQYWRDSKRAPYVGYTFAVSKEEAVRIVALHERMDPRTLFATKIERKIYRAIIEVNADLIQTINQYLQQEPISEDDCLGDNDITCTARFENGVEADVSCCCDPYEPDKSNLAWSEAVLFYGGNEVATTKRMNCFVGEWKLEYAGDEYIVTVKPKEESHHG